MDPVSLCRVKELIPAFWAVEWRGCSWGLRRGGPARTWALPSGVAGAGAEASFGCIRVSNPEVEVINKVSTGQKRECSPKISADASISSDS